MARPLRIAYATLVDLNVGGAPAIHTLEICRGLAELGHEVILFSPQGWQSSEPFRIVSLPFWRYPRLHRLRNHLYWLMCCAVLFLLHLRKPFHCVYSRYIPGMILIARLARFLRLPWVAEVNGTTEQLAAWGFSPSAIEAAKRLWARELAWASAIITQGSGVAQKISSLYEVAAVRIHVVDNGVDPRLFSPGDRTEARVQLGIPQDSVILGYIGSYQVYHDLEVVVNAMPELRKTHPQIALYCVGSGRRRRAVEKLSQDLGVADVVKFFDAAPYSQIPQYIAAFDLCLLTVPREFLREVRAFKIREYLSCGRPVLATADGELEDPLVSLCVTVEPDSVAALKDGVTRWFASRESLQLKALESSRYVAEEFSWLAASRKTLEILRNLT